MKLLEYEGKELLAEGKVSVPRSYIAGEKPEFLPAVVKSQVPVGGRGKAGGVVVVKTPEEYSAAVDKLLQLDIKGFRPKTLLAEELLEIDRELYLSLIIDKDSADVVLMAHNQGGVEVESNDEESYLRLAIGKLLLENGSEAADEIGQKLADYYDLPGQTFVLQDLVEHLYKLFIQQDMTLLEINPLVVTKAGDVVAGDAKVVLDDAAHFRHPEWDYEAEKTETNFVTLDERGNVATIANGAGLAMATVDAVADAGLKPANFLDIGGGANEASVLAAFRRIMEYPNVRVIIINIFAGITRCDEVARAIIAARAQSAGQRRNLPPLAIRLAGTNYEAAATLLEEENIQIHPSLHAAIDSAKDTLDISKIPTLSDPSQPARNYFSSVDVVLTMSPSDKISSGSAEYKPEIGEVLDKSSGMNQELLTGKNVIVQGITGAHGSFHARAMIAAGTNVVAGTSPGKGGQKMDDVPVYNTVTDIQAYMPIDATVIFVPAAHAKGALLEAIDAEVPLIVCITEGVPIHDMMTIKRQLAGSKSRLVGPNCPGILLPGSAKLGIIPASMGLPGRVGIVSRSGTLTYEATAELTEKGVGQKYVIGVGGDPIKGTDFTDCLELFQNDPEVDQIVMIGEIGGTSEYAAADYIAAHVTKPVYAYVTGHHAPAGVQLGHAGAILGSDNEGAGAKTAYLAEKGAHTATNITALVAKLTSDLK